MYLHKDTNKFKTLIKATANVIGKSESLIEKDYYVFMLLKKVVAEVPDVVFKGGTSLSKAYGIIDRFSEDIDLCLVADKMNSNKARKKLNTAISKNIKELGLRQYLGIKGTVDWAGDYLDIRGGYNKLASDSIVEPYVKVETAFRIAEYPHEKKEISSYIGDYLSKIAPSAMNEYGLQPFVVETVHPARTFIDKLFALGDYYIQGKNTKYSRHMYDIYMISKHIGPKGIEKLKELYPKVKDSRKGKRGCSSAEDGASLKQILINAMTNDFYKNDYENLTSQLLYTDVTYEECKQTLFKIINSGIIN